LTENRMPKRKLPYSEGDFFAVPLKPDGYAVGIAIRIDGKGGIIGHFFQKKYDAPPAIDELESLTIEDSIHIEDFGDIGLRDGNWQVIGHNPKWDRTEWPMPTFGWFQPFTIRPSGKFFEVILDENLQEKQLMPTSRQHFESLPYRAVSGYLAVEYVLGKLLSDPDWRPFQRHLEWMPDNWKMPESFLRNQDNFDD